MDLGGDRPLNRPFAKFRYSLEYFVTCGRMRRSDGARVWSTVLSELAQVRVAVEWERPTWRGAWQDGPTRGR